MRNDPVVDSNHRPQRHVAAAVATPMPSAVERRRGADAAAIRVPSIGLTRVLLVLNDILALSLATVLSGMVFVHVGEGSWQTAVAWMWPLAVSCLLAFVLTNLYPGAGMGPVEELRRVALVSSGFHLVLLSSFVIVGVTEPAWYLASLVSWFAIAALVLMGRAALRSLVARRTWWGVPVVLLGARGMAPTIVRSLRESPGLDLKVIGFFDDDHEAAVEGIPRLGSHADIGERGEQLRFRRALITEPDLSKAGLGRLLERHAEVLHEVFLVPNLFGIAAFGLAASGLGGSLVVRSRHHLVFRINRWAKRVLDLVLLVPLAIPALPVVALGVLAVVIVSPGNPFYAQRREGYGGRMIDVWKLRTMHAGADEVLEHHLQANPADRVEWERSFKLRHDPRILPVVGHLLRRASLDELPQLWNVAKGEMSLVGPRPFPEYHLQQFGEEFRALRHSVMPGITGLWQVSVRADGDLVAQEQLDSYYIRNWSIWFDLYLLCRTPIAVLFSRGAY